MGTDFYDYYDTKCLANLDVLRANVLRDNDATVEKVPEKNILTDNQFFDCFDVV